MDLEFRKEFHDSVQKFAGKYGLDNIIYGSFTLQYGYRIKYNASDFVYAMLGVLESIVSISKNCVTWIAAPSMRVLIRT